MKMITINDANDKDNDNNNENNRITYYITLRSVIYIHNENQGASAFGPTIIQCSY